MGRSDAGGQAWFTLMSAADDRDGRRMDGGRVRLMLCRELLEVDFQRLQVVVGRRPLALEGLQLKLLLHFARHPDWVLTRSQLLTAVWGADAEHRDPKSVDVLVCRLRKQLGPAGASIESVRSFGYRLRTLPDAEES
jgi:DNA-binding response OmpR family regulator